MIDFAKFLATVQFLARGEGAWRGHLSQLAELVRRAGKWGPEDDSELERLLRKSRILLGAKWECGLWESSDGSWRLVSLAIPSTPTACRERMQHKPIDPGSACRWCLLTEKRPQLELRPDLDLRGEQPTPGALLHRQCLPAWRALRALAQKDHHHV